MVVRNASGFSQGKEASCLGKETAFGRRGCIPDHLEGLKANVQRELVPLAQLPTLYPCCKHLPSFHRRGTEAQECHFLAILFFSLSPPPPSTAAHPAFQVPME